MGVYQASITSAMQGRFWITVTAAGVPVGDRIEARFTVPQTSPEDPIVDDGNQPIASTPGSTQPASSGLAQTGSTLLAVWLALGLAILGGALRFRASNRAD